MQRLASPRSPESLLRTAIALLVGSVLLAASPAVVATADRSEKEVDASGLHLPWQEAGLTKRQAAAHLLSRFAYGARSGEVDRVVELGLDVWLESQLAGGLPDTKVDRLLSGFRSLAMTTQEMVETYPNPGLVMREAAAAGAVDGVRNREDLEASTDRDRSAQRRKLMEYAREQGYRPQREMIGEMMINKLARARYSENQLTEVLTDFWFNHFNVSITDNEARIFVGTYEGDAIRPHVLGDFRQMLEATAKHPAMLLYLDNARSVADGDSQKTFDRDRFARNRNRNRSVRRLERRPRENRRPQGLNENYARELMELHTLGVDAGYTQNDVIEVARAFTGWTTYPPGRPGRRDAERRIERAKQIPGAGFVFEESFLFRADAHDAGKKTILGKTYPAGRGIEDGLEVLDALTTHPATARNIAHKLAVRFVSDEPPAQLVDRLAARFLTTGGDLRQVVRTLAESPEFWDTDALRSKIKSPFEVAVSALRTLDAEVEDPRALLEWVRRMGQPLYAYQAPTGYPDRAEAWVNTGSLLNRMNFGLQLATGRIAGLQFDLASLDDHREPASLDDALATYVPLLMPERDPSETLRRLRTVIHDPELAKKIAQASTTDKADTQYDAWDSSPFSTDREHGRGDRHSDRRSHRTDTVDVDTSPLAHVVGVILGSPEFQRR